MAGFSKSERLSERTLIQNLFSGQNDKVVNPPVMAVYQFLPRDVSQVKVLFSVSKKRFPRAVDRNRVKRRLREAYRLTKEGFYERLPQNQSLILAVIYIGHNREPAFDSLLQSFENLYEELIDSSKKGL